MLIVSLFSVFLIDSLTINIDCNIWCIQEKLCSSFPLFQVFILFEGKFSSLQQDFIIFFYNYYIWGSETISMKRSSLSLNIDIYVYHVYAISCNLSTIILGIILWFGWTILTKEKHKRINVKKFWFILGLFLKIKCLYLQRCTTGLFWVYAAFI